MELQVLEEFLRRRPGPETGRLLAGIVEKIKREISWTDFYTAERAVLERGGLFGQPGFSRPKPEVTP